MGDARASSCGKGEGEAPRTRRGNGRREYKTDDAKRAHSNTDQLTHETDDTAHAHSNTDRRGHEHEPHDEPSPKPNDQDDEAHAYADTYPRNPPIISISVPHPNGPVDIHFTCI